MAAKVSSWAPRSADSISFSSLSVVPVTAEWTIKTRTPVSRRERVICAILRQLASEETLVPPNFRTTHCGKLRATMKCLDRGPTAPHADLSAVGPGDSSDYLGNEVCGGRDALVRTLEPL